MVSWFTMRKTIISWISLQNWNALILFKDREVPIVFCLWTNWVHIWHLLPNNAIYRATNINIVRETTVILKRVNSQVMEVDSTPFSNLWRSKSWVKSSDSQVVLNLPLSITLGNVQMQQSLNRDAYCSCNTFPGENEWKRKLQYFLFSNQATVLLLCLICSLLSQISSTTIIIHLQIRRPRCQGEHYQIRLCAQKNLDWREQFSLC